MEFIRKYPSNPLVRDAHFQVFSIETQANTIQAYNRFIKRFPSNPFVDDAWTSLYRLSISDYNKESIERFAKDRSEEHTSELQSRPHLVCRLLLEKKKKKYKKMKKY